MDFSIVIPTRKRPKQLKRVIDSIKSTAKNFDQIQIVLRVDNDDIDTLNMAWDGITIVKKSSNKYISDLWNECYDVCIADRLMMCADDVIFRTMYWDEIIIQHMPCPKTTLHFVWGNDGYQGESVATLPFLSRFLTESLGYFVPCGYIRDYCDTHLHDIAKRLKNLNINIMCYVESVLFEHMHPVINKAKWDDTYKRRHNMGHGNTYYGEQEGHRIEMAQKLHDIYRGIK